MGSDAHTMPYFSDLSKEIMFHVPTLMIADYSRFSKRPICEKIVHFSTLCFFLSGARA